MTFAWFPAVWVLGVFLEGKIYLYSLRVILLFLDISLHPELYQLQRCMHQFEVYGTKAANYVLINIEILKTFVSLCLQHC